MTRRASSNRWLERQARDRFVKRREQQGYRSRSAYKLLELNEREHLLRSGSRVIDLGAAPGGWTQVAAQIVGPKGTVVALDVLKMEAVAGATIIQGDCRAPELLEEIGQLLKGGPADLVMSDMAPNITGIAAQDEAAANELALMALGFAQAHLRKGGALLLKLFRFPGTEAVVKEISRYFESVQHRKPEASRAQSREFYVVAKRFGI